MTRTSVRQAVLQRLEELLVHGIKDIVRRRLMGLSTVDADALVCHFKQLRDKVTANRYLGRGSYRCRTQKFDLYLRTDHDNYLTDREFLFHFRVTRHCFWQLVDLLKDHPSFKKRSSDSRGSDPKPPRYQMLVLLKYFGSEGNGASSISLGTFFGIASGAVITCKESALEALLSLESRTYIWPNPDERKAIANRIKERYLFPNCVGIMDGTLLPLAQRPLLHGENYMSRKRFYAIVMLVVCDDQCRILYYHIGWPGSVHDNRVWRTCNLFTKCGQYFSNKEYLLGDSAFTASDLVIPPFKAHAGCFISANQSAFNTLLAKPRVKSEHCIGRLKGRLPFLRGIRMQLGNKVHMDRIIRNVRGAVVLHNFLIDDPIESDWIQLEGGDDLEPEGTTSNQSNEPDYKRRNDLFYYLSELPDTAIN